MAIVLTTRVPSGDLAAAVHTEIGAVALAGGMTSGVFTEHGLETTGSLVVCLGNADGSTSGTVLAPGRDSSDAGQTAARVMLAGWPFRMHYPRGVGIAMAREGMPAGDFLESWRRLMGPKMRTVCGVQSGPPIFTSGSAPSPMASVACLEGPYATGFGYVDALGQDGAVLEVPALIHGAIDATRTAMKRLEGQPARVLLVIESEQRRRALGGSAADEWAAIRGEAGEATSCVGWLCERVAAYGRGVRPVDSTGGLVVIAIGDIVRAAGTSE